MLDFLKSQPAPPPKPALPAKISIGIEMDLKTAQMQIFAPLNTPEERTMTAQILADAIKIALRHQPQKIVAPPPGFNPAPKNGTPPLAPA